MSKDTRDLLAVLKAELDFVEKGGYRLTSRAPWRPQFIFQDSPTCLNFDPAQPPRPCSDCVLMQVIPEELRRTKIACRYIPLNEKGETIDSFYRYGTRDEMEAALRGWLRNTIDCLERTETSQESGEVEIHVRAKMAPAE
ncbi:MAG: hypothetical protein WBE13_02405 [Candidatus Acidiferrum sp.]